jgi:iron(III) transport system substrate-binding protein
MDPTISGIGSNEAAKLYVQLGEDFIKRLFIDQKIMISRERRQLTDGLARGSYPISFGAEDGEVQRLRQQGLPILPLYGLQGMPASVTGGDQVGLFNRAPHPNAAKIFVNWIASKEGNEIYGQAFGMVPARNDTDESSFQQQLIPQPTVDYFDSFDWEFTVTAKEQIRLRMKELLQAR